MRNGNMRSITTALLAAALFAISPVSFADERPSPKSPKAYNSPREVFEAYREAIGKRNWRTAFLCWVPERREDQVFEAYFGCNMKPGKPEVIAALKKYGVEESAVDAEYTKRYKEKHGIDLDAWYAEREKRMAKGVAKAQAEWAAKEGKNMPPGGATGGPFPVTELDPGPPQPPDDSALLRQIVVARVIDKVGFVDEATRAVISVDADPVGFTPLEHVCLNGDKAQGRTSKTSYHFESRSGKAEVKVGDKIDGTFHFRKLVGGWLIESEE